MKCCIFALVRGHDNLQEYETVRKRNIVLHERFNKKANHDVILFHEGNIKEEHQLIMKEDIPNLTFVDISDKCFQTDKYKEYHEECIENDKRFLELVNNNNIDVGLAKTGVGFNIGYSHMCQFYSIDWLEYLKDYDWAMRLDDDCVLNSEIPSDFFEKLDSNGIQFAYCIIDTEYHCHTVNSFNILEKILTNGEKPISMKHYYSNFNVFKLSFWRSEEISRILGVINDNNYIYKYRWGDSPIQSAIINKFMKNSQICFLDSIDYVHGSHNIKKSQVKRCERDNKNKIERNMEYLTI